MPAIYYVLLAFPKVFSMGYETYYGLVRAYFLLRLALLAAAQLHISWRCGGRQLGRSRFARFAASFAALLLIIASIQYSLTIFVLDGHLGHAFIANVFRDDTFGGLSGVEPGGGGASCQLLHTQPNVFSELSTIANRIDPALQKVWMAWGAPFQYVLP